VWIRAGTWTEERPEAVESASEAVEEDAMKATEAMMKDGLLRTWGVKKHERKLTDQRTADLTLGRGTGMEPRRCLRTTSRGGGRVGVQLSRTHLRHHASSMHRRDPLDVRMAPAFFSIFQSTAWSAGGARLRSYERGG